MSAWKFQLYPAQPDRIAKRYGMDDPAKAFESLVNDALRYPFRFHKVNKLCICLGPSLETRPLYREVLGVGDRHYPDFDFEKYLALDQTGRTLVLERVTKDVFAWLYSSFEDANFVLVAAKNLGWLGFAEPDPRAPRASSKRAA